MAKNIRGDVARIRKIVVYTKILHHIRKYPSYTTGKAHTQWQCESKLCRRRDMRSRRLEPCSLRLYVRYDLS